MRRSAGSPPADRRSPVAQGIHPRPNVVAAAGQQAAVDVQGGLDIRVTHDLLNRFRITPVSIKMRRRMAALVHRQQRAGGRGRGPRALPPHARPSCARARPAWHGRRGIARLARRAPGEAIHSRLLDSPAWMAKVVREAAFRAVSKASKPLGFFLRSGGVAATTCRLGRSSECPKSA